MAIISAKRLVATALLFTLLGFIGERQVQTANAWDHWYGPSTATVWDYDYEDRAQLDLDIFYFDWTYWLGKWEVEIQYLDPYVNIQSGTSYEFTCWHARSPDWLGVDIAWEDRTFNDASTPWYGYFGAYPLNVEANHVPAPLVVGVNKSDYWCYSWFNWNAGPHFQIEIEWNSSDVNYIGMWW